MEAAAMAACWAGAIHSGMEGRTRLLCLSNLTGGSARWVKLLCVLSFMVVIGSVEVMGLGWPNRCSWIRSTVFSLDTAASRQDRYCLLVPAEFEGLAKPSLGSDPRRRILSFPSFGVYPCRPLASGFGRGEERLSRPLFPCEPNMDAALA